MHKKIKLPKKHLFTTQYVQKIPSWSFVQINPQTCPLCTARREGRVQEDNLEHFVEGLMCSSAREDGHPHKLSYILDSFDTTQFHFQFHIRLCNQPTVAATLVLVQYL